MEKNIQNRNQKNIIPAKISSTVHKIQSMGINFKANPLTKEIEYNALDDKYAFGYFQNQSVQRHLKKLLKNIKNLPSSTENRKIIGSLSDRDLQKRQQSKQKSHSVKTQHVQLIQNYKIFTVRKIETTRAKTQKQLDVYYPYKQNLKLKSLQKLRQSIQKKQKLLRRVDQGPLNLPRLKTLSNLSLEHENKMVKLIEKEDRRLASKIQALNRLKQKQLVSSLSKNAYLGDTNHDQGYQYPIEQIIN